MEFNNNPVVIACELFVGKSIKGGQEDNKQIRRWFKQTVRKIIKKA